MSRQPEIYRAVVVRTGSDGRPRWGVQRPGAGGLLMTMGRITECVREADARQLADERNQMHGLASPVEETPRLDRQGAGQG